MRDGGCRSHRGAQRSGQVMLSPPRQVSASFGYSPTLSDCEMGGVRPTGDAALLPGINLKNLRHFLVSVDVIPQSVACRRAVRLCLNIKPLFDKDVIVVAPKSTARSHHLHLSQPPLSFHRHISIIQCTNSTYTFLKSRGLQDATSISVLSLFKKVGIRGF